MGSGKYFGKYRGTVINNSDPEQGGRMILLVPDVLGAVPSNWAEACISFVPLSAQMSDQFVMPPVGTVVWVEFEKGDPDFPVWVGCQWVVASGGNEVTGGSVTTSGNIVIQSAGQHSITVSDLPGSGNGIKLESPSGATILVNDDGIFLQNGKGASFTMVGPSVMINNGALAIT